MWVRVWVRAGMKAIDYVFLNVVWDHRYWTQLGIYSDPGPQQPKPLRPLSKGLHPLLQSTLCMV